MPDQLPQLTALRCFEAAARLESFSRAGDELHVTHGAISRQIRLLEEQLGIKLFERRSRRVFLTEPGRTLLSTTSEVFARLRDTCASIRRRSDEPLVLSCEPTLTQRWLIPRLSQLQADFPELVLQVKAAGGPVQFERDRVDLAIRRNDFRWSADLFAELIVSEEVGPVCSPELAQEDKSGLLRQTLIHSATRPDAWEQWFKATKRLPSNKRSSQFEHFYLSIEAAVSGLGVAIGPRPLVDDDLESGRLVAPFGFTPSGFGYYLLSRRSFDTDKRADSLLGWLRKRLVIKERQKSRRPSRSGNSKTKNKAER